MSQYAKSRNGLWISAEENFEDQFKAHKVERLRRGWYFWKTEAAVIHACSYDFLENGQPKCIGALDTEDNCCFTCKAPAPDEVNGLAMLMKLHDSR
jgi:hypothetical protein